MDLQANDKVVDLGCGDGKVLLRWAQETTTKSVPSSFVGIDIDQDRIEIASRTLEELKAQGRLVNANVSFHCRNALDCQDLLDGATVFFLYLIPRGLRLVKPLLMKQLENSTGMTQEIRVITYMSPLPDETPTRIEKIQVPHQPGASWPLYFYKLERKYT